MIEVFNFFEDLEDFKLFLDNLRFLIGLWVFIKLIVWLIFFGKIIIKLLKGVWFKVILIVFVLFRIDL